MHSRPSRAAEALVAVLTPPASREEVLGDLHERYRSPGQYGLDVLRTIPLVILSRLHRTADPQVLLMQAFALCVSFLAAAWFTGGTLLRGPWGLLRLAIPAAIAMLGMMLEDAYANPGRRSALKLVRGPLLGLGLALASQGVLWAGDPGLSIPRPIALYGCAMSLLLSSAVRLLFPPMANQLQEANAPATWLKQAGVSEGAAHGITLILKVVAAIVATAAAGSWIADQFSLPKPRAIASLLLMVLAYQLWKRA